MTRSSIVPLIVGVIAALLMSSGTGCSDEDHGADPDNHAPVILSITAEPDSFYSENFTTVTVTAEDADGDRLEYEWAASQDWLTPMPSQDSSVQLTNCCVITEVKTAAVIATVRDGRGGKAVDSVFVWVIPH